VNCRLEGEKLVIVGGGTTVGKMAPQFARLAVVRTIIATASISHREESKGYGATHFVARQAEIVEQQVRAIGGNDLVHVLDCTPGRNHNLAVSLLSTSKKGMFVHLTIGNVYEDVVMKKKAGYEAKLIWGGRTTILSLRSRSGASSLN
jgi:NADPH:quinone reductase-like Zn-dependent oxidoreductase